MSVLMTDALRAKLETLAGAGAGHLFCSEFGDWKRLGAHVLFGKDSKYRKPQLDGEESLMHVHLIPGLNQGDIDLWLKRWTLKRPAFHRTSDHVLVYVENMVGDYLLIAILDEPGAHAVADMLSEENVATMEGFAAVADAFCKDGSVIA